METNQVSVDRPLVGAWQLVSFQNRKNSSEAVYPFGEDARGTLIYTATGRYSVQLMRAARPRFAATDQMKGTPDEIKTAFEGCISYYGSYEFHPEAGFVVHHVEGSVFPNWEGHGLKRFCEFAGDRLKLTTPPTVWGGGGEMIGLLEWQRIG